MLSKIIFVRLAGLAVPLATALQHQFHARLPVEEPPHRVNILIGLSGRSLSTRQDDGVCPIGYTTCSDGCMPVTGVCCGDIAYVLGSEAKKRALKVHARSIK